MVPLEALSAALACTATDSVHPAMESPALEVDTSGPEKVVEPVALGDCHTWVQLTVFPSPTENKVMLLAEATTEVALAVVIDAATAANVVEVFML